MKPDARALCFGFTPPRGPTAETIQQTATISDVWQCQFDEAPLHSGLSWECFGICLFRFSFCDDFTQWYPIDLLGISGCPAEPRPNVAAEECPVSAWALRPSLSWPAGRGWPGKSGGDGHGRPYTGTFKKRSHRMLERLRLTAGMKSVETRWMKPHQNISE